MLHWAGYNRPHAPSSRSRCDVPGALGYSRGQGDGCGAAEGAEDEPGSFGMKLHAYGGAELVGAVGALPGEVGLGAAEVAVGRGLGVDRAEQVQRVDDGPR